VDLLGVSAVEVVDLSLAVAVAAGSVAAGCFQEVFLEVVVSA